MRIVKDGIASLVFSIGCLVQPAFAADDSVAKEGVALLLGKAVLTDATYQQALGLLAVPLEMDAQASDAKDSAKRAITANAEGFHDALMAAETRYITKDTLTQAMAKTYERRFSLDELTQILQFVRSDAGAKYLRTFNDQTFGDELNENIRTSIDRNGFLGQVQAELRSRFPAYSWDAGKR